MHTEPMSVKQTLSTGPQTNRPAQHSRRARGSPKFLGRFSKSGFTAFSGFAACNGNTSNHLLRCAHCSWAACEYAAKKQVQRCNGRATNNLACVPS